MEKLNKNSVSLAGEFAVLSQLVLRGYDANLTLGHTKGIDILASNSKTGKMLKIEVKTNYLSKRSAGGTSKLFGKYVTAWPMSDKHEKLEDPNLFYCFVNISKDTRDIRFFILPSSVVAKYIQDEHNLWLKEDKKKKNFKF